MSKEVISIISVICIFIIGIYKVFYKRMKEKAEKTATKADDIALMIAELIVPIVEKFAEDRGYNGIKDNVIKELAQKEVKANIEKIGEKVADKVIINAVDKAMQKTK